MSVPIRKGDLHNCPIHGMNKVSTGGKQLVEGIPIARLGDACDCGGLIISTSIKHFDEGIPIAYDGAVTSCGGVISASAKRSLVK